MDSSGTTTYGWDFENRLTSVVLPGTGGTVTFKYDPFGRRIQKSSASGTTNYIYDGSNSVEEADQTGAELAHYSQGAGIDEPLAAARGGAVGLYEQDALLSVTSLTGSTGTVLNSYSYDAFGNLASSTGSFVNPYQFTGRDYDAETGLRYYRARYYDPSTGHFLSEDPSGFGGGLNLYQYVQSNPTTLLDSFGWAPQYGQPADHSHPPASCHWPTCFWYYGNWGGPGWTGGQWKPLEDLTPEENAHLAPPIDAQDACYEEHDYCYSRSRVKNKCTAHDKPNASQQYQDDQDTAQCDFKLARCLGGLGKDPSWNPSSAIAEPLFDIKWLTKTLESDPAQKVDSSRPLDWK